MCFVIRCFVARAARAAEKVLRYLDAVNAPNLPPFARLQQQVARARSLGALGRNDEAQSAINSARYKTCFSGAWRSMRLGCRDR